MKANVTVKGYTNVVLVLNMKRFVADEDQERFEKLRGTQEFANILREAWNVRALASGRFETVAQEKQHRDIHDELSTEEIGFATGIFRSPMLEEFTFPTYALKKESVEFPDHLMGNYQFKNLFLTAWKSWRIFIRPSFTGLFILRLTRPYEKATPLMDITHDVIKLQESLDVQSARRRLIEIQSLYADQPDEMENNRNSVLRFLAWLGADESSASRLLYAPVQWKLAMEVCKIFVEAIGFSIPLKDAPLALIHPEPKLSNPLHDSYVIYHFDEMWANRRFVSREEKSASDEDEAEVAIRLDPGDMQPVHPRHIRSSLDLQQQLASLIEGALLKKKGSTSSNKEQISDEPGDRKYAPRYEPDLARKIIETDVATWEDEFCLLTPRATVIIPSRRSRHHELLITTLPSSTTRFEYVRYWGAVERMIEFIIEIHVLARLLERRSFSLVEELAETMNEIRGHLFLGDIRLHERLPRLITHAAHLRRLTALCQAFSDPHFWSRAEYATSKASQLMEQLGLPAILDQIDRNIGSINSVVDHVDEWYMADLAEQSNDMSTLLSLGLAAASFTLTLLVLPSFWTDLYTENINLPGWAKFIISTLGTLLAIVLMSAGAYFTFIAVRYGKQIIAIMRRSLARLKKTFEK
ncbi:MAG TPA: hypothetical protein VNK49_06130 [Anaerolineales bacterium]|nr:hypothetical protein [Anaerolineales bacterium]